MKRTPWAAVVGFGLTGVANTMLGPLLPSFQARWNLPDGLAGLLFTALFAAAVCGSAAVRPLAARYGHFGLAARGMALTAVGVAGCSVASWPLILVCVAVFGCGLGLAIPAANLGVAGLEAGDSAHALLWLNLIWSGGAVLSPLLVALLGSWFLPLLAASFVVIAVLVGRWAQTPQPAASEAKPIRKHAASGHRGVSVPLRRDGKCVKRLGVVVCHARGGGSGAVGHPAVGVLGRDSGGPRRCARGAAANACPDVYAGVPGVRLWRSGAAPVCKRVSVDAGGVCSDRVWVVAAISRGGGQVCGSLGRDGCVGTGVLGCWFGRRGDSASGGAVVHSDRQSSGRAGGGAAVFPGDGVAAGADPAIGGSSEGRFRIVISSMARKRSGSRVWSGLW